MKKRFTIEFFRDELILEMDQKVFFLKVSLFQIVHPNLEQ